MNLITPWIIQTIGIDTTAKKNNYFIVREAKLKKKLWMKYRKKPTYRTQPQPRFPSGTTRSVCRWDLPLPGCGRRSIPPAGWQWRPRKKTFCTLLRREGFSASRKNVFFVTSCYFWCKLCTSRIAAIKTPVITIQMKDTTRPAIAMSFPSTAKEWIYWVLKLMYSLK